MSHMSHDPEAAPPPIGIDKPDLVRALHAILPASSVLHDDEDLRPYECDGLSAYRRVPLAVVITIYLDQPRSTALHQFGDIAPFEIFPGLPGEPADFLGACFQA